ncbi:hypothetical protein NFI96_001357 [Prochilodus magdalenae]|nr:hypothetical protein NFI96_001357 [Prochilodus magdalenae]
MCVTPWFNGWGFNLPRGQSLLDKWNQIPEDTDILMTHGPPLGFRDWVPKELQRVGCVELLNTVQRRVRPKLHVYGGIHEDLGTPSLAFDSLFQVFPQISRRTQTLPQAVEASWARELGPHLLLQMYGGERPTLQHQRVARTLLCCRQESSAEGGEGCTERSVGVSLPTTTDIYTSRCRKKATWIMKDPTHPAHSLFVPLPSGRRLRSIKCKTYRRRNSFIPETATRTVVLPPPEGGHTLPLTVIKLIEYT